VTDRLYEELLPVVPHLITHVEISKSSGKRRIVRCGKANTWYRAFGEEGLGRHPRAPTDADSTTTAPDKR
jgi:hypothetical protein